MMEAWLISQRQIGLFLLFSFLFAPCFWHLSSFSRSATRKHDLKKMSFFSAVDAPLVKDEMIEAISYHGVWALQSLNPIHI